MNEQRDDLLSSRTLHDGNPFRVSEGYFDSLEDRLMARIAAEEEMLPQKRTQRPVWRILKPALTLAAMFALIFGMGYGVLSLTHTLDRGAGTTAVEDYASAEEQMIRPISLINYYETASPVEEPGEIDEEALINYLSSELSYADLAAIYAQSY